VAAGSARRRGRATRDRKNPDAALRDGPLYCLPVLDRLLPDRLLPVPGEPGRWNAGPFYDPWDGRSYGLTATLRSADVMVVRVYVGMPFLGRSQTVLRVQQPGGTGWC
jgi:hypothetical protein